MPMPKIGVPLFGLKIGLRKESILSWSGFQTFIGIGLKGRQQHGSCFGFFTDFCDQFLEGLFFGSSEILPLCSLVVRRQRVHRAEACSVDCQVTALGYFSALPPLRFDRGLASTIQFSRTFTVRTLPPNHALQRTGAALWFIPVSSHINHQLLFTPVADLVRSAMAVGKAHGSVSHIPSRRSCGFRHLLLAGPSRRFRARLYRLPPASRLLGLGLSSLGFRTIRDAVVLAMIPVAKLVSATVQFGSPLYGRPSSLRTSRIDTVLPGSSPTFLVITESE